MRICIEYTLTWVGGFPVGELPLQLEIDGAMVAITADDRKHPAISVDLEVDRSGIRLAGDARVSDAATGRPLQTLEVGDVAVATEIACRVADSMSFITRVPLFIARKTWYPELIEEDDRDAALLDGLGTRVVASRLDGGRPGLGSPLPLIAQNVAFLCDRVTGVRLYADALKMGTSAGRLRDLWRVLESGFAKRDKVLIELLSTCEAATDMEFTLDELTDLLVLRGRASHAQSRAAVALDEVVAVERDAARVVNRVQGLAEALILRKVTWGDQTLAVRQPPRPFSFVKRDGSIVMYTST